LEPLLDPNSWIMRAVFLILLGTRSLFEMLYSHEKLKLLRQGHRTRYSYRIKRECEKRNLRLRVRSKNSSSETV
jgi:hypothetical protein